MGSEIVQAVAFFVLLFILDDLRRRLKNIQVRLDRRVDELEAEAQGDTR
jgi:hypothetical protein